MVLVQLLLPTSGAAGSAAWRPSRPAGSSRTDLAD